MGLKDLFKPEDAKRAEAVMEVERLKEEIKHINSGQAIPVGATQPWPNSFTTVTTTTAPKFVTDMQHIYRSNGTYYLRVSENTFISLKSGRSSDISVLAGTSRLEFDLSQLNDVLKKVLG